MLSIEEWSDGFFVRPTTQCYTTRIISQAFPDNENQYEIHF